MKDTTKYPMYIAVSFGALGFLLMFLAWNGAAEKTTIAAQFPFLISGGVTGLALVGVGMTLAIVTEVRKTTAELTLRLEQMAELVAGASPAATGPTARRPPSPDRRPRPRQAPRRPPTTPARTAAPPPHRRPHRPPTAPSRASATRRPASPRPCGTASGSPSPRRSRPS